MKGRISQSDFIESVKTELFEAAQKGGKKPLFTLEDVELETEFSIEAEGKAGFKFFVDLEGKTKGAQTHRVKLRLKPISPSDHTPSKGELPLLENSQDKKQFILQDVEEIDPNKGRG